MDLQNEKREHPHLLHSLPSEVEAVRIVVISVRNVANKQYFIILQFHSYLYFHYLLSHFHALKYFKKEKSYFLGR